MDIHANAVLRSCFHQLRQLRTIRSSLTTETTVTLVHAFIASHIDNCNTLLYGASARVRSKFQSALNASARLIYNRRLHDHITPTLRDHLHWLPIDQRINYKVALHAFKCLHSQSPSYLMDMLNPAANTEHHYHLRSAARGNLCVQTVRTHIGSLSFRYSAPAVWNKLPLALRDPNITDGAFRKQLKRHLFYLAYNI